MSKRLSYSPCRGYVEHLFCCVCGCAVWLSLMSSEQNGQYCGRHPALWGAAEDYAALWWQGEGTLYLYAVRFIISNSEPLIIVYWLLLWSIYPASQEVGTITKGIHTDSPEATGKVPYFFHKSSVEVFHNKDVVLIAACRAFRSSAETCEKQDCTAEQTPEPGGTGGQTSLCQPIFTDINHHQWNCNCYTSVQRTYWRWVLPDAK